MDAIVGAGGVVRADDALQSVAPVGTPKALLPLLGRPMVQYVLDAISKVARIQNVIVIGLDAQHGLDCPGKQLVYLPSAGSLFDNARQGCRAILERNPASRLAVWFSADVPLITPAMVDWFLDRTLESDRDLFYQLIRREVMLKRFPESKRTYTHLQDRVVCAGDVAAITPAVGAGAHPLWEQITAARKNPLRQAQIVGVQFLWLLLTRQLSVPRAEQLAGQRLGLSGVLLDCPFAEMGMDVDKPLQYALAERELRAART